MAYDTVRTGGQGEIPESVQVCIIRDLQFSPIPFYYLRDLHSPDFSEVNSVGSSVLL